MRWEEKHRPKKFSKVHGQDHAVDQLAGLIRNGKIEKHVALFGRVGSGKTSLISIFAMALNCLSLESDGSPCGECKWCLDPTEYLHEYDTAGRAGSKEDVLGFIQAKSRRFWSTPVQIFFFDEVHRMSAEAQDALLVFMEKAPTGTIVCIASTEKRGMRTAFLSRFLDIEIRPLAPDAAYSFIKEIGDAEHVEIAPSALRLFVASQPPQARDLIVAFQGLSNLKVPIDDDLIKKYFNLGICDHLARYFEALANGDRAGQSRSLVAWEDSPSVKRRAIETFVTEVYFNDVVGEKFVVDPLIHHMVDVRQSFVSGLMKRHGVTRPALIAGFERMMEFWSSRKAEDDSSAYLTIALFGSLVDGALGVAGKSGSSSDEHPTDAKRPAVMPPARTGTDKLNASSSLYLDDSDARQIINRSSFFVQHYGRTMNATALIKIRAGEPDLETAGRRVVTELSDEIGAKSASGVFGYIATIERHGPELHIRFVVHVERDLLDEFEQLFSQGFSRVTSFAVTDTDKEPGMAFHQRAIRDLCSGCALGLSSDRDDLRFKLGIRKDSWRYPGPTDCQHLFFSDCLTSSSIEAACFPHMTPLLPMEVGAHRWAFAGWELREFVDRRVEQQSRVEELATLDRIWKDDSAGRDRHVARRMNAWCAVTSEQRVRAWRGWW